MKTTIKLFVLLLLSLVVSHSYSQTWSYRPTVFGNGFVSTVNNQAQAATYLGFASLTNNNTWTGTNTFPAASFYPANNIGMRLLWSSPTNSYFPSITSTATTATNAGGWALMDPVLRVTLPALIGSNSTLVAYLSILRTNANVSSAVWNWFIGSNTNFLGTGFGAAATSGQLVFSLNPLLQNTQSFTNQLQPTTFTLTTLGPTNFCDTSAPFDIYIGQATATSHTNLQVLSWRFYEIYAP